MRFQLCPRQGEHGPVLVIYDLDAQPFGSNVQQQLFAKLAHGRVGFDQTFQPGFQILEPRPVAAFQLALRSLEINRLIASFLTCPSRRVRSFPPPWIRLVRSPVPAPLLGIASSGVWKYSEIPCSWVWLAVLISHMSRKNAIIAVTKSA